MAAQPFYHRTVVLFTATKVVDERALTKALASWARTRKAKDLGIVPGSIVIEEYEEPEAGDPHDL